MKLRIALVAAVLTLATPALASAPQVSGRAFLVTNATTGDVLAGRNADVRVPIASITKLMTVIVALERADPSDVVTVTRGAAAVGESTIGLRPGERLTVRELVQAALIQSANDAAAALADYVGRGDRGAFVRLMNAKARELGLSRTQFVNPDGLDAAGHYSTARDVTRLARAAMELPLVRAAVRTRETAISGGRRLETWNDLLYSFPGLIGVKTGHTSGAGWSEVAAARGPGFVVYVTLLGEATRDVRNDDLTRLLAWGVSRYRTLDLVRRGRAVCVGRAALRQGDPPDRRCVWQEARRTARRATRREDRCAAGGRASGPEGPATRIRPRLSGWPPDSLVAARRIESRREAGRARPCRLVRRRDR